MDSFGSIPTSPVPQASSTVSRNPAKILLSDFRPNTIGADGQKSNSTHRHSLFANDETPRNRPRKKQSMEVDFSRKTTEELLTMFNGAIEKASNTSRSPNKCDIPFNERDFTARSTSLGNSKDSKRLNRNSADSVLNLPECNNLLPEITHQSYEFNDENFVPFDDFKKRMTAMNEISQFSGIQPNESTRMNDVAADYFAQKGSNSLLFTDPTPAKFMQANDHSAEKIQNRYLNFSEISIDLSNLDNMSQKGMFSPRAFTKLLSRTDMNIDEIMRCLDERAEEYDQKMRQSLSHSRQQSISSQLTLKENISPNRHGKSSTASSAQKHTLVNNSKKTDTLQHSDLSTKTLRNPSSNLLLQPSHQTSREEKSLKSYVDVIDKNFDKQSSNSDDVKKREQVVNWLLNNRSPFEDRNERDKRNERSSFIVENVADQQLVDNFTKFTINNNSRYQSQPNISTVNRTKTNKEINRSLGDDTKLQSISPNARLMSKENIIEHTYEKNQLDEYVRILFPDGSGIGETSNNSLAKSHSEPSNSFLYQRQVANSSTAVNDQVTHAQIHNSSRSNDSEPSTISPNVKHLRSYYETLSRKNIDKKSDKSSNPDKEIFDKFESHDQPKLPSSTSTGNLTSVNSKNQEVPYPKLLVANPSRRSSSSQTLSHATSSESISFPKFPLTASHSELVWECVKVNTSNIKAVTIQNRFTSRIKLKISIVGTGFRFNHSDTPTEIVTKLQPNETRKLDVIFAPTQGGAHIAKVNFMSHNANQFLKKIPLFGYGGRIDVQLYGDKLFRNSEQRLLSLGALFQPSHGKRSLFIHNSGDTTAFAHIKVLTNVLFLQTKISVDPCYILIAPRQTYEVIINVAPHRSDLPKLFTEHKDVNNIARLQIIYGAEITRLRLNRILKKNLKEAERMCNPNDLAFIFQKYHPVNLSGDLGAFKERSLLESFAPLQNGIRCWEISATVQKSDRLLPSAFNEITQFGEEDSVMFRSMVDDTMVD